MFAMQRWLLLGPFQRVRLIIYEIELGSISQHRRLCPEQGYYREAPVLQAQEVASSVGSSTGSAVFRYLRNSAKGMLPNRADRKP